MKIRTAIILNRCLLLIMMTAATLAVSAFFLWGDHDFTVLIMLVGFWPAFIAHLIIEKKIWLK